jgi:hypothetical protein
MLDVKLKGVFLELIVRQGCPVSIDKVRRQLGGLSYCTIPKVQTRPLQLIEAGIVSIQTGKGIEDIAIDTR